MEVVGELRWYGRLLNKSLNELRIVVLSDWHYGNPLCSVKHIQRTLDFVKEYEDVYVILNGDLIEAVTKLSKGDIHKQEITPQEQAIAVYDMLEPIKDKVLSMTTGNHEMRIYNEVGHDYSKEIADKLKVPYRPEGVLQKIMFGCGNNRMPDKPFVFWGYCTHGYGGARTKSAKAVKVERASTWVRADFTAMSHDHVVNAAPDLDLTPDNRGTVDPKTGFMSGKIVAHNKRLIKTNAYLKWGGYSELGGFPPTELTAPVIWLLTPKSDKWGMFLDKPRQAVRVTV